MTKVKAFDVNYLYHALFMALRKVKGNIFFGSIIHINVAKIKAATKICGFENPSNRR